MYKRRKKKKEKQNHHIPAARIPHENSSLLQVLYEYVMVKSRCDIIEGKKRKNKIK